MALINVGRMKVRVQGTAIAAGCAAISGAVVGLLLGLFGGDPNMPMTARLLGLPLGGAIISVFTFLLYYTPINRVVASIVDNIPFAGLVLLPFVLFHYLLVWPGLFVAEQAGLIVLERG